MMWRTALILTVLGGLAVPFAQGETLTMSIMGQGSTEPPAGSHTFSNGETVFLSAMPDSGWRFDRWEGDLTGTNPSFEPLVMDSDKNVTAVFVEITAFDLTIIVDGAGTTDPAPGTTTLNENTPVTITAIPDAGFAFDRWEGDFAGEDRFNQSIVMDSDKTVTAVFAAADFTLTMDVIGEGGTSPPSGESGWIAGREADLFAFPTGMDASFDRWEGDLTGSTNPATLTMDGDKVVTAVFTGTETFELTVSVDGNGTTDPAPGTRTFAAGQTVTLNAFPDAGFAFDRWEGDLTGNDGFNQAIVMDADKSVTAFFAAQEVTLSIDVEGAGDTRPAPGVTGFLTGRTATITAVPVAMEWSFDRWEGDLTGSANPGSLTMDADKSVTAVFTTTATSFDLTTQAIGMGSVDPAGTTSHAPGAEIILTATPDPGWQFVSWQDGLTGTENPATLTLITNTVVTAVFTEAPESFTLDTSAVGSGTVDPPGITDHEPGSTVTVTATANVGWEFTGWQGALSGSNNPETLDMDANKTVSAIFTELPPAVLTMSVTGQGVTSPAVGTRTFPRNTEVALSATPAANWAFVQWTGALSGSENPTTLVLDESKSVNAVFERIQFSLTTSVSGNGTVTPAGTTDHDAGSTVSVTAVPDSGWHFDAWEGDLTGSTNPASVTMDASKSITAVFLQDAEGEAEGEGQEEGDGEADGEGQAEGDGEADGEGQVEGDGEADGEGQVEGDGEADGEGQEEGDGEADGEGQVEGDGEADGEGQVEGDGEADGEGQVEGEIDPCGHSADQNGDCVISLSELLRVIQFFNSGGYRCDEAGEDGYGPGFDETRQDCPPHNSDYNPQNWQISLSELLRLIQFFNSAGYFACEDGEDGFCAGLP